MVKSDVGLGLGQYRGCLKVWEGFIPTDFVPLRPNPLSGVIPGTESVEISFSELREGVTLDPGWVSVVPIPSPRNRLKGARPLLGSPDPHPTSEGVTKKGPRKATNPMR